MGVFAIRIECPLDVAVQRPQHTHARVHQGPAVFGGHDKRLDRGLPFVALLFGLRKSGDVVAGIAQSHQRAPTRQQDGIIERASPGGSGL